MRAQVWHSRKVSSFPARRLRDVSELRRDRSGAGGVASTGKRVQKGAEVRQLLLADAGKHRQAQDFISESLRDGKCSGATGKL